MKKHLITTSAVSTPVSGFPVATRAGHLLFISGRFGLDSRTGLPIPGYEELGYRPMPSLGLLAPDSWEEAFVSQAAKMYRDLEILLQEQGARKTDLLFYSIYLREMRNFPLLARTRAALFEGGVAPPSTASQVRGLLFPDAAIYFDPVALVPDSRKGLRKEVLESAHVVQGPLSNYELASRAGSYTFYAGVVGAHPETGTIVQGANELKDADWPRPAGGLAEQLLLEPVSGQSYTIYKLLRSMLSEHSTGLERVLRLNFYLRNMRELPEVERIGRHFLSTSLPAATVIGVDSLARPDFHIEIEAITCSGGALQRAAPDPKVASWGRYVNAVRGGDLVFVSGLFGYDTNTRRAVSDVSGLQPNSHQRIEMVLRDVNVQSREQRAAAVQTQCILDQLQVVLASLDSKLDSLLKLTVYLRDVRDFSCVRKVLLDALGDDPPAITALAVSDLPLSGARVQIEAVAL